MRPSPWPWQTVNYRDTPDWDAAGLEDEHEPHGLNGDEGDYSG